MLLHVVIQQKDCVD